MKKMFWIIMFCCVLLVSCRDSGVTNNTDSTSTFSQTQSYNTTQSHAQITQTETMLTTPVTTPETTPETTPIPQTIPKGGYIEEMPSPFDGELYRQYDSFSRKYGYIDKHYNRIIADIYDKASEFNEGYSLVQKEGKWGLINKANKLVVPNIYDDSNYHYHNLTPFSNGLLPVKTGGYWGCVDFNNNTVIDFMYDGMSVRHGLISAGLNGSVGLMDIKGNYIIPLDPDNGIDSFVYVTQNYIIARTEGHFSLYSREGKLLLDDISRIVTYSQKAFVCTLSGTKDTQYLVQSDGSRTELPDGSEVAFVDSTNPPLYNNWLRITIRKGEDVKSNLINNSNELLFDEWLEDDIYGLYDEKYFRVGAGFDENTRIYTSKIFDINGNYISSLNSKGFKGDPYFEGSEALALEDVYLDLRTGQSFSFDSIEKTGPYTAIVKKGVFYGLLHKSELIYDLEYTKISGGENGFYTLEKGINKKHIRISMDGQVEELDDLSSP